ncbi:MAG: M13 family metallopeptidase, partial [Acidobacteriota bacterium]|nr:M13 family metallopeptidase [Acidobacteriota bacterium]
MRANYLKVIFLTLALLLVGISHQTLPAMAGYYPPAIDAAGIDRSIDPGDDFFGYANGAWLKTAKIPEDRASYGIWDVLSNEANQRTSELIKEASKAANGTEERKIGDYYAAFMNEQAIERKGLTPLKPELDEINSIADKTALARLFGSQLRADVDPLNNTNFYTDRLFGIWVSPDFNKPDRNVAYMLQGGLGLPDRDNYLSTDAHDVELQAKYRAHIATVLKLAGVADAD